jgi:AcrR family transcriptional regulator
MPALIDRPSRTQSVVAAVDALLAREGVGGLTLRRIARESRVSTSSLMHHYESREHLLCVAMHSSAHYRLQRITQRLPWEGVHAFLPRTEDDVAETRAWLAWAELGRAAPTLGEVFRDCWARENAVLSKTAHLDSRSDEAHALAALLEGLRSAVCLPMRPLALEQARSVLTAQGWPPPRGA